jgi:hypothetical protein
MASIAVAHFTWMRVVAIMGVLLAAVVVTADASAHTLAVWKARATIYQATEDTYGKKEGVVDYGVNSCWRMTTHAVRCRIFVDGETTAYRSHCVGTAEARYANHASRQPLVRLVVRLSCRRELLDP